MKVATSSFGRLHIKGQELKEEQRCPPSPRLRRIGSDAMAQSIFPGRAGCARRATIFIPPVLSEVERHSFGLYYQLLAFSYFLCELCDLCG